MGFDSDAAHHVPLWGVVQLAGNETERPSFPGRKRLGKYGLVGGSLFSALTLKMPHTRGDATTPADHHPKPGEAITSAALRTEGTRRILQTSIFQSSMASESTFDVLALEAPQSGDRGRRRRRRHRQDTHTCQRVVIQGEVVPVPSVALCGLGQVATPWQPLVQGKALPKARSGIDTAAAVDVPIETLALSGAHRRPQPCVDVRDGHASSPNKRAFEPHEATPKNFGRESSIDTECSTVAPTVDALSEPLESQGS